MNKLYSILAATILLSAANPTAQAAVHVSVDFFHDRLEDYGDWREVGDYGYVWQPREVSRNWRPYSDGRWLYTDAGWTWDSEEPYAWAVYHYGRWARVDRVGWVWVPGTEWGPAWVSWRRSSRHVGWAPLPPDAEFDRSVGFSVRVDADYDIGPTNYNFVDVRDFGSQRLRSVIVRPQENITIIRNTTNITNITYVNNVVYNQGPQYDTISRQSREPIRQLKLERSQELDADPGTVRAEQLRSRVQGDSLRVVSLPVDAKAATAPKKVVAKVEKAEVDRGWKNAGSAAEVAKLRTKIKSEPAIAAEPAPQPKKDKAAEAPAVVPPAPVPAEKPVKGKGKNADKPKDATSPEVAPVAPPAPVEKPVKGNGKNVDKPKDATSPEVAPVAPPKPSEKPVKGKPKKGDQPKDTAVPEAAPVTPTPEPSAKPTKGKIKSADKPKPPVEPKVAPTEKPEKATPLAPVKKHANKVSETPRPPVKAQPQERAPKVEDVKPPRKAPAPAVEKVRPSKPEPRPKAEQPAARKAPAPPQAKKAEPSQPAPPAAVDPQSAKAKEKAKKKGTEKPVDAPQ